MRSKSVALLVGVVSFFLMSACEWRAIDADRLSLEPLDGDLYQVRGTVLETSPLKVNVTDGPPDIEGSAYLRPDGGLKCASGDQVDEDALAGRRFLAAVIGVELSAPPTLVARGVVVAC